MRFAAFKAGMVIEAGARTVSADEIIEFASRYDPQWFHTDPERAAAGRWKGLIASGWHTSAIAMEMAVEAILKGSELKVADIPVDHRRRHPPGPEALDADLLGDLAIGLIEAGLQFFEGHFHAQPYTRRAQLFDVSLHVRVTPGFRKVTQRCIAEKSKPPV